MPVRAVLNVVYLMATEHKDAKARKEFDDKLYGFDVENERANKALWNMSGGES
jgi:hypothetical protein